jgi:hypothetical protein
MIEGKIRGGPPKTADEIKPEKIRARKTEHA